MKNELRPCLVKGEKALFHKWNDVRQIVEPSNMIGGHGGGVISQTFGMVEMEDGTVKECYINDVKFTDNKINEYCFD